MNLNSSFVYWNLFCQGFWFFCEDFGSAANIKHLQKKSSNFLGKCVLPWVLNKICAHRCSPDRYLRAYKYLHFQHLCCLFQANIYARVLMSLLRLLFSLSAMEVTTRSLVTSLGFFLTGSIILYVVYLKLNSTRTQSRRAEHMVNASLSVTDSDLWGGLKYFEYCWLKFNKICKICSFCSRNVEFCSLQRKECMHRIEHSFCSHLRSNTFVSSFSRQMLCSASFFHEIMVTTIQLRPFSSKKTKVDSIREPTSRKKDSSLRLLGQSVL